MSYCTNCGAERPEKARFCTKCGTPVDSSPLLEGAGPGNPAAPPGPVIRIARPEPAEAVIAAPAKPRRRRKILAPVVVALLGLLVIAGIISWFLHFTPGKSGGKSPDETVVVTPPPAPKAPARKSADANSMAKMRGKSPTEIRTLAETGDVTAQYLLGKLCQDNRNPAKDYREAAKWLRKAAEQGDADAQYEIGMCYISAQGVERNEVEGRMWLLKAADQGNAHAQITLDLVGKTPFAPQPPKPPPADPPSPESGVVLPGDPKGGDSAKIGDDNSMPGNASGEPKNDPAGTGKQPPPATPQRPKNTRVVLLAEFALDVPLAWTPCSASENQAMEAVFQEQLKKLYQQYNHGPLPEIQVECVACRSKTGGSFQAIRLGVPAQNNLMAVLKREAPAKARWGIKQGLILRAPEVTPVAQDGFEGFKMELACADGIPRMVGGLTHVDSGMEIIQLQYTAAKGETAAADTFDKVLASVRIATPDDSAGGRLPVPGDPEPPPADDLPLPASPF